MESIFRYIIIIAIAFMIGKEVFQSIRQKSVDWVPSCDNRAVWNCDFHEPKFFSYYLELWLSRNMYNCPRYLGISFREVNENLLRD